ncbi:MAG: T9SS type A sorting domain-containing protein [Bacteroidia bacterium]
MRISQLKADKEGNALVISAIDQKAGGIIQTKGSSIIVEGNDTLLGYPNMHLCQYNSKGGVNWHLSIKSKEAIYAHCLEFDSDNNYYIGGSFKHDALFTSTKGNNKYIPLEMMESYKRSLHRFFIAKYKYDGELLWVKTGLSWDNAFCKKIVCDKKGNTYAWVYTPTHTLVFDDILFAQNRKEYFIGRHKFVLAKIDSIGEIKWITRSGDDFGPGDFWLTENGDICVEALANRHWYFFLYLDGTRKEIKELDKYENEDQFVISRYIFSSKTGKLIDRKPSAQPSIFGHHARAFASKAENYEIVLPYYATNRIRKDIELNGKRFSHYRNGKVKALCKLKSNGQIDWYLCIKADMNCDFVDIEEMNDGTMYAIVFVRGKSTFIHSSGDSISYPYNQNMGYSYLLKLNEKGQLLERKRMGSSSLYYRSLGGFLSSADGRNLYLADNYKNVGKYLGQHFDLAPRDPNYPLTGGYINGYVCLNPLSKDSIEVFETDSTAYELYASVEIEDTSKNQIAYYSKADSTLKKKDDVWYSNLDSTVFESEPLGNPKTNISLFPNPVKSQNPNFYLAFNYNGITNATIEIFSNSGALIYNNSHVINNGQNEINIELQGNLSPGTYIIRMNINGKPIVKRLVIS